MFVKYRKFGFYSNKIAELSPKVTLSKYLKDSAYPISSPMNIEILGPIISENMMRIAGG